MVGNPAVNASFRSVVRSAKKKGSSTTYNAWAFARVISEKAEPNCSAVRTAAKLNPIESGGAIALSSSTAFVWNGWSGFHKIAALVSCGITCFSSCRRLG